MFWHDIKEIKCALNKLNIRITQIEQKIDGLEGCQDDSLDILNNKLQDLLSDKKRIEEVQIAQKILDKFEDYMKNVDKLNEMMNEFKGCVSMARGALEFRRTCNEVENETLSLVDISEEIRDGMTDFIKASYNIEEKTFYKLNYVYENMEKLIDFIYNQEKKSPKRKKSAPKKRNIKKASEE